MSDIEDDTTIDDIFWALDTDGYSEGTRWLRAHLAAKDAEIAELKALNDALGRASIEQEIEIARLRKQVDLLEEKQR